MGNIYQRYLVMFIYDKKKDTLLFCILGMVILVPMELEKIMKFKLNTNYSEEELKFFKAHNCEILSEINLSKTNFSEYEVPRRMFKYGGAYIAEIIDDETNNFVWAVLSKWKGVYHFSAYYDCLEVLEQGL